MTEDQPFVAGPRLSSIVGLQEAGILESFHFDPVRGLVGVAYLSAYIEILRSGLQAADPGFFGAVILDDPIAMRIWIEATAVHLASEGVGRRTVGRRRSGRLVAENCRGPYATAAANIASATEQRGTRVASPLRVARANTRRSAFY